MPFQNGKTRIYKNEVAAILRDSSRFPLLAPIVKGLYERMGDWVSRYTILPEEEEALRFLGKFEIVRSSKCK